MHIRPPNLLRAGPRLKLPLVVAGVVLAAVAWKLFPGTPPEMPAGTQPVNAIVARGRIEPQGRVLAIHGPAEGAVVAALLVDQGDTVSKGQPLAILDGFDVRQAELSMAENNLKLTELMRRQVSAGAKHSDIAAQRHALAAKEAQLVKLDREWERRHALFTRGYVSQETLDALKADRGQVENEAAQAASQLKSLTETRSVDEQVADARVEVERAGVARARAQVQHLVVRAPVAGSVLSIQSRVGEMIGPDGLLRMAGLDHIMVVAEVEEGLAAQLRDGMSAIIETPLLAQPVTGKVTRIAHEVFREKRPASDVLVGRDAKIVEVDVTPDAELPAVLGGEVEVRLSQAAEGKS